MWEQGGNGSPDTQMSLSSTPQVFKEEDQTDPGIPSAWVPMPWGEDDVLHAGEQLNHEAKAHGCPLQQSPTVAVCAGTSALDPGERVW